MRFRNRPPVAVAMSVAAVAALAVTAGAVMAYRQGPRDGGDAAAPLPGSTGTAFPGTPTAVPKPSGPTSAPPSAMSSVLPSALPSAPPPGLPSGLPSRPLSASIPPPTPPSSTQPPGLSGPAVVELSPGKVARLSRGRGPQLTYLVGREVRGGVGGPVAVPGTAAIRTVGRIHGMTLAVVAKGNGEELLRIRGSVVPQTEKVAGVNSLVVNADGSNAAYATVGREPDGTPLTGSTVYAEAADRWDTDTGPPRQLKVPGSDVTVLAYAGGRVYFTSAAAPGAAPRLYAWTPGTTAAARVESVLNASAVTPDGRLVAWRDTSSVDGSCSTVSQVATRKRLWRTCDYEIIRFTAGGSVAIGRSTSTTGSGSAMIAAIDATTGTVLREWKGVFFTRSAAEDDDHLLLRVDDGIDTPAAIIRCTVSTGACELATPLTTGSLALGS